MTVVLAFSPADADQALALLDFIGQLGGCQEYSALLVVDAAVDWSKCIDALTLANRAFRDSRIITTESPVTGWPAGANALWLAAAKHCKSAGTSFLWLEADSIPLKRGWLVSIDKMRKGSRYFGHIYMYREQVMQVMSGIAVYPPEAFDLIAPCIGAEPTKAWDVSSAEAIIPLATHTKLIHHFYGEKDLAPTFVENRTAETRRNAFTLDQLPPEAVIYHRNKDGALIELLRKKFNIITSDNFVVVLPFCMMDVLQLIKNLGWMKTLGTPKTHDCLLSIDRTTNSMTVQQVKSLAKEVFCNVHQTAYNVPHGTRFPQTAAWQHAARVMQKMDRPWLWLEADAIPLKKQWLSVLQTIYDNCRMPFAGPIVSRGMHMNGTPSIFPSNTPDLLPRTMSHTQNAFDVEYKDEMAGKVKDIGHIAVARWGIKDGFLNELEGEAPNFPPGSNHLLNQIPKTAVVFHRDKSGSLIDRLTT
jgi:hypothetical protein